ncbi:MAG: hypothetical protein ACFE95_15540 [Candidatus Hodarchaeota archaeon]
MAGEIGCQRNDDLESDLWWYRRRMGKGIDSDGRWGVCPGGIYGIQNSEFC